MGINHEDEGFEALFKPIQDLTRNWEVDLSLHLEEYMNYIRQICGDNIPDMNFAQAAVLVQNSANIYSKKVDFLFTHVLQLFDTLSKKQIETLNQENEASAGQQPAGKKRKTATLLETEEFITFDEVCSDRVLTLDLEKEKQKIAGRKKPKIVLNAAIKVKAKEHTSCNVYHCGQDVMGKKEEFRLNWRICSAGTLHEEFVVNKDRFRSMEPVELSICQEVADDSHHSYTSQHSPHIGDVDHPPSEDELPSHMAMNDNAPDPANIDRESEDRLGQGRMRKEAVKTVDVKEIEWQSNDFNTNIKELPIKKRKVVKIPPGLDDDKKRKNTEENPITSYTAAEVFFDIYKNGSFYRDLDFGYQSKLAVKHKRHLLLNHRIKYQAFLEKEAGIEQVDDFPGFYNEEDSDNGDDFVGFDGPDIDVPLPDKENILEPHNNDMGLQRDGYENAYEKALFVAVQAYNARKVNVQRDTDMAEKVEKWHQFLLPKLEQEEERRVFDIHDYGTEILEKFNDEIGRVIPFAEIVAGKPREEVARYFLAVLLLGNQLNVEITKSDPDDLSTDCVILTLLSVVRHHEKLDDNLKQTSNRL